MPYANEHAARQTSPEGYASVRSMPVPGTPGARFVLGIKPGGGSEVQSVRFAADKFTVEQARAWLREHDFLASGFEPATGKARVQRRMEYQGLPISIEREVGDVREWTDRNGNSGATVMRYPYGFVRGTKGEDDEQVDVYVGPLEKAPAAYVVHQQVPDKNKPGSYVYDEDKVMLGFGDEQSAREAYLAHYTDPRFLGGMSVVPMSHLREMTSYKSPRQPTAPDAGKGWQFKAVSIDEDQGLVFGWQYIAEDGEGGTVIDHSGEFIPEAEHPHFEKAVYGFVEDSRAHRLMHGDEDKGHLVESCMITPEKIEAMKDGTGKMPRVAHWVGYRVTDKAMLEKYRAGELPALSMRGKWDRTPVDAGGVPRETDKA